ncbi:hypothetical protein OZX73_05355 [Bifidobacterium sp. ESL0775]|uniref:hypothetical protein n=1 Tax=Bifidobacterium sp. ESL0775 TaxID=2983230 RepID=UPI0023F99DA1|nr:hypothetical protein [Bifidobacterium sp. ESL0775]WEV68719.1 hypothetical protein OZX73_05355 [Bifidobacterium sp. ESL0775]
MTVLPPDLELYLTGYLRSRLPDIRAANKEPNNLTTPLEQPVVIVRDDSGPKGSPVTFDRSIGVTVLAGSKTDDKPANDLARLIYAHLTDPDICIAEGSPIAAVVDEGCNGPYAVQDDHDYARRYMTIEYTVVGKPMDSATATAAS